VKLNFIQQGQGPAVVLIHGLFGSLSNLGMLARELTTDHSVYLIDLRNHGDSPHSSEMDYSLMAADVLELMDDQNIESAHIVGHSMGGKAAMQTALLASQRVGRLVVMDIAPVTYPHHHKSVLAGLKALDQAPLPDRKTADTLLSEYVAEADLRPFLLKNLEKGADGLYKLKINLPGIVKNYKNIAAAPVGEPFNGPTLFVKGSESDYITEQYREAIIGLFPRSQLKIIDKTGHWLHAEKPALVNRIVYQFLIS